MQLACYSPTQVTIPIRHMCDPSPSTIWVPSLSVSATSVPLLSDPCLKGFRRGQSAPWRSPRVTGVSLLLSYIWNRLSERVLPVVPALSRATLPQPTHTDKTLPYY